MAVTWNVNIFASVGKARLPSSCVVLKLLFYYDFSDNEGPVILHSPQPPEADAPLFGQHLLIGCLGFRQGFRIAGGCTILSA